MESDIHLSLLFPAGWRSVHEISATYTLNHCICWHSHCATRENAKERAKHWKRPLHGLLSWICVSLACLLLSALDLRMKVCSRFHFHLGLPC